MEHHSDPTAPPAELSIDETKPQRIPISEDDRRWILIAHYGASVLLVVTLGVFGWLAGLLTLFLKGGSPIVRAHAVESVNFQLTWGVLTTIGVVLAAVTSWTCFGLLFEFSALVSAVFALTFSLIAGKHASRGELFQYPVSFRIVQ